MSASPAAGTLLVVGFAVSLGRPAQAHLPHDNVYGAAAPVDLSTESPWLVSMYNGMIRSEDGGRTFLPVGGELLADTLGPAAWLPSGVVVQAGERGLWWTEDGGQSWDLVEIEADTLAVAGEQLYAGGELGLWEGPHPTELEQVIEAHRIVQVQGGPLSAVAIDSGGALWWSDVGGWSPEEGPEGLISAVVHAERRYVGTAEGEILYQEGGEWLLCTELPYVAERDAVVRLASTGEGLLAATASRAPFYSSDGCGSWSDRSTGRDTEFAEDVSGGAMSDDEAFTVLQGQGEAWLVGGWSGLFISRDAGSSWDGPVLVPPDYTRAIAYPEPWDGRTVFVGANSAGVLRSMDLGRSFDAPSHGLGSPNVQRIYPVPGEPMRLWAVVGHVLYLSSDGGHSWQLMSTPFSTAAAMLVQEDRVWLSGSDRGSFGHVVATSSDGGRTWRPATGITEVFEGATPVGMFEVAPYGVCASGSSRSMLACGPGPAGPFEVLYEDPVGGGVPALSWPPGVSERLLVVDEAGIHLSEDEGQSWATVLELGSDVAKVSAAAADGSLWMATAAGRVWRSLDGGQVWEDLDVQLPSSSRVLTPMPNVGAGGGVLVGTAGGIFEVVDPVGEAPWMRRWGDHQWLDASSAYTTCPGCPGSAVQLYGVSSEVASLDWTVELAPDSWLEWTLRGRELLLHGQTDGSTAVVYVDGLATAWVGANGPTQGVLARIERETEGPHRVELHPLEGDGVRIDGAQSYGRVRVERPPPTPVMPSVPTETSGCGGGAALMVVLLPLCAGRRRDA